MEEKISSLEITIIIFKVCKKVQNLLSKHPFFLTLETVLKTTKERNKVDVKSIRPKVTKHIEKGGYKAEVDLN